MPQPYPLERSRLSINHPPFWPPLPVCMGTPNLYRRGVSRSQRSREHRHGLSGLAPCSRSRPLPFHDETALLSGLRVCSPPLIPFASSKSCFPQQGRGTG